MAAEGNNVAQSHQAFNTHQQQLNNELPLCANYDTTQVRTQLATLTQLVNDGFARMNAQ